MKLNNKHMRTLWPHPEDEFVLQVIDQRFLPFRLVIEDLKNYQEVKVAIKDMHIRGAPLIGAVAGFGVYIGVAKLDPSLSKDELLLKAKKIGEELFLTRPTAVNLKWAVDSQLNIVNEYFKSDFKVLVAKLKSNYLNIIEEDVECCKKIGIHALPIVESIYLKKNKQRVNILTHCNAGWLACVDYGTATSVIYQAFEKKIDLHVYVDETRPRNQGARLTAYELSEHGVNNTLIVDNAGGHLMQHGLVDMVIVGADRVVKNGDAANKIGTYLKALAAYDNKIPFYVAIPSSSFDWVLESGKDIEIEERDEKEVRFVEGLLGKDIVEVNVTTDKTKISNFGFDVTPARLITGIITERGICHPSLEGIKKLYPEKF